MAESVSAWVGGYMGRSYGVRVEAGRLTYQTWEHGYSEETESTEDVDAAALERFWGAVGELGVWDWDERYENLSAVDGTSWSVELEHGGRRLEASGSNDFPPEWDPFCAAASRLAGGRVFR